MNKKELLFVLKAFLIWRVGLFTILFMSVKFLPLQQHFLGGGVANYLKCPWFWAWANFDGANYLSISQYGYLFVGHFFPFYPLLMAGVAGLIGNSVVGVNIAGLLISNISFFVALLGLYKLVRLDYSKKITRTVIILILLFPSSFYFGSVYSESLFLALVVWSFYFAREGKWLWVGIMGVFTSATRVVGILLLPALLVEYFSLNKSLKARRIGWNFLFIFLVPVGFFAYAYYLFRVYGDPFAFFHSLSGYGVQRSATLVILPQVFYRYIFRVLPNIDYSYFPAVFVTILEFIVGIVFLGVSIISLFRLRLSYAIFVVLGYLIPTFSGSFSSLPRYVLVLFPAFILLALWINRLSYPLKLVVYGLLFASLVVASAMFLRGYWIS